MPRTGGVPLRTRPQPRKRYHEAELDRWRQYLGMPLALKPKYYPQVVTDPDWNKYAGWMVIAAELQGVEAQVLSHALLRALWAEDRDTARAEVRRAIADENGYDGSKLVGLERSEAVQAAYDSFTAEAEALGVFGAPTFVLDGEIFWGQDRLDFVDRKLDWMRASAD